MWLGAEVGFNAGHSSAIWLEGTGVQVVHSFDVLVDAWSTGAVQLIGSLYPGRHVMHQGDSIYSIPRWWKSQLRAGKKPCDLWYIDGKHTSAWPYEDMYHAYAASRNGTTMVADDCTRFWGFVLQGWEQMKTKGLVRTPTTFPGKRFYPPHKYGKSSGFCAGVVVKPAPLRLEWSVPSYKVGPRVLARRTEAL